MRFSLPIPEHWSGSVAAAVCCALTGRALQEASGISEALHRQYASCEMPQLTQALIRGQGHLMALGLLASLVILVVAWLAYREVDTESRLRRALAISNSGFALAWVTAIGGLVGLFVLPIAKCGT
jgi:hypothetical protein